MTSPDLGPKVHKPLQTINQCPICASQGEQPDAGSYDVTVIPVVCAIHALLSPQDSQAYKQGPLFSLIKHV